MINNDNIPFQTIDWTLVPKAEYESESSTATW